MYTGEMIRKLRLLKEFTQKGMAIEMGISQQAYSKIEKSPVVSKKTLQTVLSILRCSEEQIGIIKEISEQKQPSAIKVNTAITISRQ